MYNENNNLLQHNNHICYVNDSKRFPKRLRCPSCDTIIKNLGKFNRHIKSCKDRIQNIHPKTVYTFRDTLFNKINGFGISCNDDQIFVKNLAILALNLPVFPMKNQNIKIQLLGFENMNQYLFPFPPI